jgi:undecaprenyl diphosphate synthase
LADATLRHVGFIMDGNGRWARRRGKSRTSGHQAGAETVRRVVRHAVRLGIPYLTLYAFSTENWSRPRLEVEALMSLMERFLGSETPGLVERGVRLAAIGDLARLPAKVLKALDRARDATAGGAGTVLTLALSYGGRDELVRAARRAAECLAAAGKPPHALTAEAIGANLDTAGMPDPDLIVRTAGERRLSNFLIWQAAYAELYWSDKTWPEFTEDDFDLALADYSVRVRKYGGPDPAGIDTGTK